MSSLQQISEVILAHDHYLIVSHENPDPDSLGSMLGLYHALVGLGKTCWMMCADPVPRFSWPGMSEILPLRDDIPFQNAIVLDCEPERTGPIKKLLKSAKLLINLDHHQGNPDRGDYSYVNTHEAATSMIVFELVHILGVPLNPPIAQALYGGLVGDTGGFRHANTGERELRVAAELVAAGACPAETAREIFECKPLAYVQFIGHALSKIRSTPDGKVVWIALSHQDFAQFGVDPAESDQLVQYARMVEGSEIAILFREVAEGQIRIGFRSHHISIHPLAVQFGGGGHKLASGARVNGKLDQVVENVIAAAQELIAGGDIH